MNNKKLKKKALHSGFASLKLKGKASKLENKKRKNPIRDVGAIPAKLAHKTRNIKELRHTKTAQVKTAVSKASIAVKKHPGTAKIIKANLFPAEEVKAALNNLAMNSSAVTYLKRKISKSVLDVLNLLVEPKTDEDIAAALDLKINAVRRILNMMQDYGMTNYYISKNVNGWLSFAWYINVDKFDPFFGYVSSLDVRDTVVNDNCNDYFVCDGCYDQNKLIFTFDSAFEESFKCNGCGSSLAMISKNDATKLVNRYEVPEVIEE